MLTFNSKMADQANEGVIVVESDGEYDFMATSSHTQTRMRCPNDYGDSEAERRM